MCFLGGTQDPLGLNTSLKWKSGCASWVALSIPRGEAAASGVRVGVLQNWALKIFQGEAAASDGRVGVLSGWHSNFQHQPQVEE